MVLLVLNYRRGGFRVAFLLGNRKRRVLDLLVPIILGSTRLPVEDFAGFLAFCGLVPERSDELGQGLASTSYCSVDGRLFAPCDAFGQSESEATCRLLSRTTAPPMYQQYSVMIRMMWVCPGVETATFWTRVFTATFLLQPIS